MPRRKTPEVEISPAPGRTKIVNAKHKIEYDAPVVVADDEQIEEEILDSDAPEETERKQRRKSARDEREGIRREMESLGVVAAGDLKLMIEKYKHSDSAESGTQADKIFCTKYACSREHIMNQDYLVTASQWGAGRYWFTLRHKNKIVKPWEREITGLGSQNGMIQHVNPNDPTSPQVVVNVPENGHAVIPVDPFKEAERALNLVKKYNEALGGHFPAHQAPQRSDDEILAGAILKQPEVIENVVGSVMKRYGKSSGGDDDPSGWSVAMELVKSGQAAQIVKTLIDSFFNGVSGMIPGRQNNGASQMAQTQNAQSAGFQGQTHLNGQDSQFRQDQNIQALPQGAPSAIETGAPTNTGQQLSPEQEALALVLHHCKHQIPAKITYAELTQREQRLELLLNQHAMQTGQILTNQITLYLDMLSDASADDALAFVKTLPGGDEIASLPHAKEWTEQLQTLIKDSQEGDDEA